MSSNIRINELARELEVKSRAILDFLREIGQDEKKSHSSTIEGDLADRVRAHFRGEESAIPAESAGAAAAPSAPAPAPAAPAAPVAPATPAAHAPAPAPAHPVAAKPVEKRLESVPLTRTIEQIKAEARASLGASLRPPQPAVPPPAPPAPPRLPLRTATVPPAAPAVSRGVPERPAPRAAGQAGAPLAPPPPAAGPIPAAPPAAIARPTAAPRPTAASAPSAAPASGPAQRQPLMPHAPAGAGRPGQITQRPGERHGAPPQAGGETAARPAAGTGGRKLPSDQPIYAGLQAPRPGGQRPPLQRRPGDHRPTHPTSRPGPSAGIAAGGVPQQRPVAPRGPASMHPAAGGRPAPQRPPMAQIPAVRPAAPEELPITRKITISEGISIKELSEKLDVRAKDVIKRLLEKGIFATINQTLDSQTATEVSRFFGAETAIISYEDEVIQVDEEADKPEDLRPRAPVVTVMGHVDHGKTSLLDAIRETTVAAREAGGITQHIGAYQVEVNNRKVVFLDTPGHEAFTLMRARGARVTDVVVLVVAADDGVMPQTMEAINHARAAKVPIIVAINKIDKPDANPERVKKQLADHNLMSEEWGGETVTVEVSAKKHQNLDLLLEMILLVADMQALKANPARLASGTVLEAKLDRGRGPVATILVQNGTMRPGDTFIVGAIFGRVRAMLDDRGHPVMEAVPSTPVEVLGLDDVPAAGDRFQVIGDTTKAHQIAVHRQAKMREAALAKTARLTLEQLHQQMAAGDVKELPLIIKADVQGSVEVVAETLQKLSNDKVKVKVIHAGVGAITETDVLLASASNAVIIGFSVRPERKAAELASLEKVDIRMHTIIYELADEIRKAMAGMLAVQYKETSLGRIEIRDTFRIVKVGTVAGGYVLDGKLTREAKVRLLRDNVVVHEGRVRSLRRFKEDVGEVKSGMECGIALENFNDIKVGDVIEAYVTERVGEAAFA